MKYGYVAIITMIAVTGFIIHKAAKQAPEVTALKHGKELKRFSNGQIPSSKLKV